MFRNEAHFLFFFFSHFVTFRRTQKSTTSNVEWRFQQKKFEPNRNCSHVVFSTLHYNFNIVVLGINKRPSNRPLYRPIRFVYIQHQRNVLNDYVSISIRTVSTIRNWTTLVYLNIVYAKKKTYNPNPMVRT